jgi:hypothetical protein
MNTEQIMLHDQARIRREVFMRRVLETLRQTIRVRPVDIPDVPLPTMYVEMTNESARVIGPLLEAVDILEAIIWASDGCQGHRHCAHSMEPWQRARALLAPKWQAEVDPMGERWPDPRAAASSAASQTPAPPLAGAPTQTTEKKDVDTRGGK